LVVSEAELGGGVAEVHSVRGFPVSLPLLWRDFEGKKSEDSTAVIVDDD
jgi:hypothetical protein